MRLRGGAIEGALSSGTIMAILGALQVNGDAIPLWTIVGAILGGVIGIALALLALFLPFNRWFPFLILGGVVGAVVFAIAPMIVGNIELEGFQDRSWTSLIAGFIIGGIIGGVVMRGKYQSTTQKIEK